MSHAASEVRRNRTGTLLACGLGVATLAGGALAYLDLRRHLATVEVDIDRLVEVADKQHNAIQLIRFERPGKEGLGMPALLEQLRFWGPLDNMASTPNAQLPAIHEHITAIIDAMKAVGSGTVIPALIAAFHDTPAAGQDGFRQWLLRAMVEIDELRASEFLAQATRGLSFPMSAQLRLFAADHLIRIDKPRARQVLRRIIETETPSGLNVDRLTQEERNQHPKARQYITSYSRFYDFIARYVRAAGADAEQLLVRVLGRRHEYGMMTLQESVKALGKLHSTSAISKIKDLFERPPQNSSPMFRNHCLDALVAIQGAAAKDYIQRALRTEQTAIVRDKLVALLKQTSG